MTGVTGGSPAPRRARHAAFAFAPSRKARRADGPGGSWRPLLRTCGSRSISSTTPLDRPFLMATCLRKRRNFYPLPISAAGSATKRICGAGHGLSGTDKVLRRAGREGDPERRIAGKQACMSPAHSAGRCAPRRGRRSGPDAGQTRQAEARKKARLSCSPDVRQNHFQKNLQRLKIKIQNSLLPLREHLASPRDREKIAFSDPASPSSLPPVAQTSSSSAPFWAAFAVLRLKKRGFGQGKNFHLQN